MFTFIELSGFSKRRSELMPDNELREFQEMLINDPEAGDIIVGTEDLEKYDGEGRAQVKVVGFE